MTPLVIAQVLGEHPFVTALSLSLVLTLILLLLGRASRTCGPAIREWLETNRYYQVLRDKTGKKHRELLFLAAAVILTSLLVSWIANMAHFVGVNDAITAWDSRFVVTANEEVGGAELYFFRAITHLAGRAASLIIGFGLGLLFLYRKNYRWLSLWAFGLIGNSVLVQILKQSFQRPRPNMIDPFIREENFSFPSGHAAGAVVLYGLLAYVLYHHTPKLSAGKSLLLITGVLWLGVFIGTSRLALGVHYPTDVVTGWLVACSWLTIVVTIDLLVGRKKGAP